MILKQNGIWGEIMYENVEYDQHFIGEFDVEGDSFNGELIFNKKNGGILIHLTKDVTIESAFRYHYGKVAVIIGKLNAGIVVTLFNNRCVKNHTNNFKLLTLNFVSDYFVWSDKERRDAKLLLPLSLTELHILKEYGTSDQLETCMALKLLVDRCQISNPYAAINARVAIERLSPKQYLRFFASLESLKV